MHNHAALAEVDAVVARVDVVDDTPYINDKVFVVSLLLVFDVVRVISILKFD